MKYARSPVRCGFSTVDLISAGVIMSSEFKLRAPAGRRPRTDTPRTYVLEPGGCYDCR